MLQVQDAQGWVPLLLLCTGSSAPGCHKAEYTPLELPLCNILKVVWSLLSVRKEGGGEEQEAQRGQCPHVDAEKGKQQNAVARQQRRVAIAGLGDGI